MSIKILNKESNQLVAITNISESINKQRVTRQESAQTKASTPLKIPLGSTHVTTTVCNYGKLQIYYFDYRL